MVIWKLWEWPLRDWPEIIWVECKILWLRKIWWGEEKFQASCREATEKRLREVFPEFFA